MKLEIIELDHLGNGLAKEKDKIIFISKTIPGDIIEAKITKQHKKYDEGKLTKIITPSSKRIPSACPYYDKCGGCNISNLTYEEQLNYKKNKVINIFKRYNNLTINPSIISSENIYGYRNKITYNKYNNTLGLVSLDNEIIDIDKCLLVSEQVNYLYSLIKKHDLSQVKKIIIRETDQGLILSINGLMNYQDLLNKCQLIYLNNELVYENKTCYLSIDKLKYQVSNYSFFQINTKNIKNLYDVILKYGNFNKHDNVIDLYCGVGSISLYIANNVNKVLGIEIVEDAIKDAKKNAMLNNITNATFLCGDVSLLIDDNIKGNKVIVDPPRGGLDKHTIEVLNKSNIKDIIYVSCDPMTLSRDIKLLTNYKLTDITLVDMFPQTHHVECVCLLKLR